MTTTPEICSCDGEECLARPAAEDDPGCGATVTVFEHDGGPYEIGHLAIGSGSQRGEFAVYCDGEEVAEFAIAGPVQRPGNHHGQPQLSLVLRWELPGSYRARWLLATKRR